MILTLAAVRITWGAFNRRLTTEPLNHRFWRWDSSNSFVKSSLGDSNVQPGLGNMLFVDEI